MTPSSAPAGGPSGSRPIERRHRLGRDEFYHEYARPQRPVIVTGALDDFRATREWNHAFFRERYGDVQVPVLHYKHQRAGGGARVSLHRLGDYFAMLEDRSTWADPERPPYLEGFSAFQKHPELAAYLAPLAFYTNWFRALPPRLSPWFYHWRNLLISPGGAVYNLHVDQLSVHACILQFFGRKRFVMYPPDQAENLYFGKVDPDDPDVERFPRFLQAAGRQEGVVGPGEVCFIPHRWWHQVTTLDESVSVVEHAVDRANATDFLRERLLGSRFARPSTKRAHRPSGP